MSLANANRPRVFVAAAVVCLATTANAGTHSDALGDQAGTNDSEADISSDQITSDSANLYFQINLNADISAANFGNYLVGLQTGPGGSTLLLTPWGNTIGISSGMNFWIGSWVNSGGGAQLYQWDGTNWNQVGGTLAPSLTSGSTTIAVPISSLGLSTGDKFKFDVWSTYGAPGGQSAYDALDNPNKTVPDPWNGTPYDSATSGQPLASDGIFNPPGDANNDGKVAFDDLLTLAQHYGTSGVAWPQGDFNGDTAVDFADLLLLAQNYGKDVSAGAVAGAVPEPSLVSGLVFGTLPMTVCRRRLPRRG